jgi:hypothetical protein
MTLNGSDDMTEPISRLRKAAEALDKDATRVELLAAILTGWAKPVPTYQPDDRYRLKSGRFGLRKSA